MMHSHSQRVRNLGLIALAVSLASVCSFAQGTPQTSEVLAKAKSFYTAGAYDSTILTVRAFLKQHGKDPEAEFLVPVIMEAFLRKGEYSSVNRLFDLYQKKFRSSPFMPRVYYLHGYAQAKDRSYASAFESYSSALEAGVTDDLDSLIMRSAEAICSNALDAGYLHDVGKESRNHPRIREMARYYEIMKMLSSGADAGKVKKCIAEFKDDYPNSQFGIPVTDLLAGAAASKRNVSIGLLAPLTGDDAEIGKRVAQGAQLAIDKFNQQHQPPIKVVMYDTKGALLETVHKTQALLEHDRVPVIIGPVLSPTATISAALLLGKEAVMITPTATDEGIAELGPNIFQMNVTTGVLARKLARYALANLNIREFAVVAPRSAYGGAMTAIFKDEVTKGGGTVLDEEFFEEGGNDFRAQFIDLRHKLLLRRLDEAAKEAGTFVQPRTRISAADSTKWADSTLSIGAIFLPAEAEDAVMLAPQVAYNRIRAQLLGSNGWHSPKTIADGKQYVQNAIISTSFEPDTSWKKWTEFRKEYGARFHEEPDRVAALGFDAATIAIGAIGNAGGSTKASRIAEALLTTQRFEGASGTISFDRTNRTNGDAAILKLTPNGFVRVQ